MLKNQTRPYRDDEIPTDWSHLPIRTLRIADLFPTQYYLVIDRVMEVRDGSLPQGGDIPHIVAANGGFYIHDGHHRIILAAIQGVTHHVVRIHPYVSRV